MSPPNDSSLVRPGFRLDRFEVYNWGTLDRSVWGLDCHGENALLTGDIGSGKSTLVDGISTLLIAPQKITYNRAAGAEARERTLRTYVLGHYKSERTDGSAAKPIALRDHNKYSVILGRFTNEQLGQQVTLAEVFWWKDTQGQPARFYVVADVPLSITEHFSNFGKQVDRLRKRLREMDGVELHDSFPPYGAAYRRRLGIEGEQAMDLFYQTVSMKAVGNLTEFVRAHMLEPFDVQERIQALIGHFDDLTRAHEAVQKAKAQIELLAPLVENCERHAALVEQVESLRGSRDALTPWFAMLKGELLDERIAKLQAAALRMEERLAALATKISDGSAKCASLEAAIKREGGDRITEIQREIASRTEERDRRASKAERYRGLARAAELPTTLDAETFIANGSAIARRREETGMAQAAVQNAITDAAVEMRELNERHEALTSELESLRRRRSNIPAHMLRIRERLCAALGIEESAAPFAGELIQVREDARDWEGAIERLLHGFGLSLLVGDADYARVAEWVDRSDLKGRLVYYRTAGGARGGQSRPDPPRSVGSKLQIEPSSPFYGWLDGTIQRRFDHLCCATTDELRRVQRGITRAGQIKEGSERHEKDDRHAIGDRTRWVLGWSNERKIAALEKQAADVAARGDAALGRLTGLRDEQRAVGERKATLDRLSMFESFREIDWKSIALEIDELERELRQLEAASDRLHALREQLRAAEESLGGLKDDREARLKDQGALDVKLSVARDERANCAQTLAAASEERLAEYFPRLEALRADAVGAAAITVESCEAREREMRSWIQNRIDADEARRRQLGERIAGDMQRYIAAYPLETREVDATLESAGEFRAMLERLRSDDLPRFEGRFKELLNKNTIREIANFQSQLARESQTITERIERINQSLNDIDYNPGRFIVLETERSTDREVRDFQQELRACTEGTLTGSEDDAYSETKFAQVKRIIDRFRGREGSAEVDRRWTRTVTDVRNWYAFSASERWREDGSEYEHYTDSGGKSGGQKEKLAYTVLAASLAYQFGLDAAVGKARTFRFVVIDEAFGRGSDESARYGLELFRKLELQLLVVTPLQKIHIIEPYVAAVGFVYNPEGSASLLRNLTIEEYRAEQAAVSATPVVRGPGASDGPTDTRGNGAK